MTSAMVYLHLTPVEVWERQRAETTYLPEAYGIDGFIHCTIGDDPVVAVGNRYYREDPRPYAVLDIDPARLNTEVRFEDPEAVYPHIYGPLNTAAVTRLRQVVRDETGTFLRLGQPHGS